MLAVHQAPELPLIVEPHSAHLPPVRGLADVAHDHNLPDQPLRVVQRHEDALRGTLRREHVRAVASDAKVDLPREALHRAPAHQIAAQHTNCRPCSSGAEYAAASQKFRDVYTPRALAARVPAAPRSPVRVMEPSRWPVASWKTVLMSLLAVRP